MMSAREHLSEQQFFHSTDVPLRAGQRLKSSVEQGLEDWPDRPNKDHFDPHSIYVHDIDPRTAGSSDVEALVQNIPTYRVSVAGPMEPDTDPLFAGRGYKVKHARVMENIW